MAKIEWTFDGVDKIDTDADIPFSFKLKRYKDANTFEETLKISSLLKGKDNGFIVTTIYNLGKDIEQLKKFGVLLSLIEYHDLEKVIEKIYLELEPVSISLDDDSRFDELIAVVREYVDGNADLITKDFCYVPVNEFNTFAEDCGFYEYEIKALRRQLAIQKYIHTTENRYSKVTRIKGKGVRAIAFKRDKLGVELPVVKKDKQSKKSDSDE